MFYINSKLKYKKVTMDDNKDDLDIISLSDFEMCDEIDGDEILNNSSIEDIKSSPISKAINNNIKINKSNDIIMEVKEELSEVLREQKKDFDDHVINHVLEKVKLLQESKTVDGKSHPIANIINNTDPSLNGKNIKITQQLIMDAYKRLHTILEGKEVTAGNIAVIMAYALQISNKMLTTNKTYKVELTLAMVRKLIDNKVKDPDENMALHMLVESTLPSLLDTIDDLPGLIESLFSCCRSQKK